MAWFRKSKLDANLVTELESLDSEAANLKLRESVESKRIEVAKLREERAYKEGSGSIRSRIDARRQARGDNPQRREAAKQHIEQQRQKLLKQVTHGLEGSEGLALCAAAIARERPGTAAQTIKGRIGESMLENIGFMPFSYDFLTTAFRSLYQVQGLIRELYPYKSTVIRYIQTLDFARWACRVLYSECPTAQGLIRAKTAFVIRKGNKVKLVRRDKSNEISEQQRTAQWFIDRFLEENDFAQKERFRYGRACMDGEAFGWTANPDKPAAETDKGKGDGTGACIYSHVEPDFIRPSQKKFQSQEDPHMVGLSGAEDWSFGIHTPKHKYYKPLAYNVVWNDNDEDVIPADQMVHSAYRERDNMKRCLPPLLLSSDDLIRMTLLRSCLAESSRYRASVAGVIEYEEASGGEIETNDDIYGRTLGGASDESWEVRQVKIEGGSYLLELPPGRKFSDGPLFPPGDSLNLVYDWHIRAIAQQWGVPEWVVKGASSGASFADSLTAESPSVVEFECEQSRECGYTKKSVSRELQYRIENDQLPKDFFEQFSVEVQSDSVITRDSKAEAETHKMLVESQFESLETGRASLGLDPSKEDKLIQQEKSLGVGPVWDVDAREGKQDQPENGLPPLPEAEGIEEGPETTDGQRQQLEGE